MSRIYFYGLMVVDKHWRPVDENRRDVPNLFSDTEQGRLMAEGYSRRGEKIAKVKIVPRASK